MQKFSRFKCNNDIVIFKQILKYNSIEINTYFYRKTYLKDIDNPKKVDIYFKMIKT